MPVMFGAQVDDLVTGLDIVAGMHAAACDGREKVMSDKLRLVLRVHVNVRTLPSRALAECICAWRLHYP